MRCIRKNRIVAAAVFAALGLGTVAWSQDNTGQNNTNNPSQVQKPSKPQPVGGPGVDTSGPFNSQTMGSQGNYGQGITSSLPSTPSSDLDGSPRLEHDQAKMRNQDRQRQLVLDTQKLLALATQLKTDVDKSNKDMLSLDVVHKAEEIEKLARSVKDKMKGS